MTPAITAVRLTGSARRAELPLLVLGPAIGTSAANLWGACAAHLAEDFDILAWDLPGHGHNRSVPDEPCSIAELAAGVLVVVEDVLAQRDELGGPFAYAAGSVGGVVGLQLLLDAPDRIDSAVLLCAESTAPEERVAASAGTASLVEAGSARVREALADFDVRDRLGEIRAPVLAVARTDDPIPTGEHLRALAIGSCGDRPKDPGDLLPAERPVEVATVIRRQVLGESVRRGGPREELAIHLRAALREGLTVAEITEVLRQTAASQEDPDVTVDR